MYVWARLIRAALAARSRGRYVIGEEGRLAFRCLPSDIDFNIHLNNARYMMLADVGRIDIFQRSGLLKLLRRNRWTSMLGGTHSVFIREIKLWRRFEVVSSIDTWQGAQIIGRHRFILDSGETAALVMTTAGIYDRASRSFVPAREVFAALGYDATPRPPSEVERIFMESHAGLRAAAKRYG